MTVLQLIEKLKQFPETYDVVIQYNPSGAYVPIHIVAEIEIQSIDKVSPPFPVVALQYK